MPTTDEYLQTLSELLERLNAEVETLKRTTDQLRDTVTAAVVVKGDQHGDNE